MTADDSRRTVVGYPIIGAPHQECSSGARGMLEGKEGFQMYERTVVVALEQGLHARPASNFVQQALRFASKISLTKAGRSVDAKSILGLMGLAVAKGTEITIAADGTDEVDAVDALCDLVAKA
jgi:catabolite repression HPr-like protein